MDTTSSGGKLFGTLAEFEREIIRERMQVGLAAARARGKSGVRPRVMDERKVEMAQSLMKDPNLSISFTKKRQPLG
ncbi:recombinase family protein [Polycladomyces subterraneus]|uniref:Recombinase family protein n=1 Tax=Polycladomyces subterraneus TaxID=1016997 RepID=A0ABT8IMH7_9BACL|nr:recombinase family protein [Polycladomyces subterraneus]